MTMTKEEFWAIRRANRTEYRFNQADRAKGGRVKAEGARLRKKILRDLRTREMRPSELKPLVREKHYRLLTVEAVLRALAGRQYEFQVKSLGRKFPPGKYMKDLGPKQWDAITSRWG